MGEDFYTTGQGAKILGVTDRGVRKMLDRGELEDVPDDRGRHRIPQWEVHRLLQERRDQAEASSRRAEDTSGASPKTSVAVQEAVELRARVERVSSGISDAWRDAWSGCSRRKEKSAGAWPRSLRRLVGPGGVRFLEDRRYRKWVPVVSAAGR